MTAPTLPLRVRGVTLIELMIAMTLSLVVLLAMATLFRNTSRNNDELARVSDVTDSGRSALTLLTDDIAHAGYWGGYVPAFDDMTYAGIPPDVPTAIPDPCKAPANWTNVDIVNMLGIPIEVRPDVPTGGICTGTLATRSNSDVLVIRRADRCATGASGCDAYTSGLYYLQAGHCATQVSNQAQGGSAPNTIQLSATPATPNTNTPGAYIGGVLRTVSGAGSGQVRWITAFDSVSQTATVESPWISGGTPGSTTTYSIPLSIGTSATPGLLQRDCLTRAEVRRFVRRIYYTADVTLNGATVPALVRSDLTLQNGSLVQGTPVPLIYGVEAFRVVLGIDNAGKTGGAVDYTAAVAWSDPNNLTTPTNRGDGVPDTFVACTACTAVQLRDVVAAKVYVLIRSTESTLNYKNTKAYCLGEPDPSLPGNTPANCPTSAIIAAKNDNFQRHVFVGSIRLANVAGRRETP